jgi:hypothetical protein
MLPPTAVAQLFVMGELNRADFFAEFPDLSVCLKQISCLWIQRRLPVLLFYISFYLYAYYTDYLLSTVTST